jgi:hypothetical protein
MSGRQHRVAPRRVLGAERLDAGHRHHAYCDAPRRPAAWPPRRRGPLRTRSRSGSRHGRRLAARAARSRRGGSRPAAQRCAAAPAGSGATAPSTVGVARALERVAPGDRGLCEVARAPDAQVGYQPQAGDMLDRLVRRAVLAEADRVVRVHQRDGLAHQRCHAHRVARVVREHEEGPAVGTETAMQRDARSGSPSCRTRARRNAGNCQRNRRAPMLAGCP